MTGNKDYIHSAIFQKPAVVAEKKGTDHDEDTEGSGEDENEAREVENMSMAHRTGLAKVHGVMEWLSHVLTPEGLRRSSAQKSLLPDASLFKAWFCGVDSGCVAFC